MKLCRCGCGLSVPKRRVFVNKEHQIAWMLDGGGREMNALMPDAARELGGKVSGQLAAATGRLKDASTLGGARSREIARAFRAKRQAAKNSDSA